jgi:hypothetical protein
MPVITGPVPDEALVKELLTILNETRSRATFCMTVELLGTMKADSRLVVPAILRNAERLKISNGMLRNESQWTTEQEIVARALQFFVPGTEAPESGRVQSSSYGPRWDQPCGPLPAVGKVTVPCPAPPR